MTVFDELVVILKEWMALKKVGSVTVNFFKGGVSSVKMEETIKLSKQD